MVRIGDQVHTKLICAYTQPSLILLFHLFCIVTHTKTATQCGVSSGSALFAVFAMLSTFLVTVGNVNYFHFVNGRLQPLEVFEQNTSS